MSIDKTGNKYGRLTVLERIGSIKDKKGRVRTYYKCICDCGTLTTTRSDALIDGKSISCGCIQRERASETLKNRDRTIYGDSKERIHNIWYLIKYRCEDSTSPAYYNYGGRGIKMCEEWSNGYDGYFAFKEWSMRNGYSEELTIDRIDNNGDYTPENCRWVDNITQANNKRSNHMIEYFGEKKSMAQWAKELGIPYKILHSRIVGHKWDIDRAFTQPVRKSSH